jgi:peptidoglycan lytic transglycosylase D
MINRTEGFFCVLAISAILALAGCGVNGQSKFQGSFLPSVPQPATPAGEIAPPPELQPNLYLHDAPVLPIQLAAPSLSRAELLMHRADQAYQRGKKAYQVEDIDTARQEFDQAIDLMLEASENNPADRQTFEARFDEMVDSIHRYDLAGLGAGVDEQQAGFEKAPLEDILQMTFPVDPKLKDKVKDQIQATASQLPLSENDAVLGYINYFEGRGRKTLIAGLQREGRYQAMIQRVLAQEGIPQELIHLAQAESGFLPRAMSRKSAAGMWQFLAWRGREYGLQQTAYTDDRLDPEKATRASARHLHDLYNEFGDWYLAIAAYNCGPGVVEKAVERTGYADFWELRTLHVLPLETTNYVPIILAMTIMAKNAPEYGLEGVVPDARLEYDTLKMTSPTHLALIADLTDAPVSELMDLNPALLRGVAPAGYMLHVPKGTGTALSASLQMIPAERRASWRMHRVTHGETLASIGRRYGLTARSIAAVNGLSGAVPGEMLVIPAVYRPARVVKHARGRRHSKYQRKRVAVLTRTAWNRRPRSGD